MKRIKFFNPTELDRNLKATVHKSGKLGFTVEAAKKMNFGVGKSISIGINEEDEADTSLYVVTHGEKQNGAFNVAKAGSYYYVNTKILFDALKLDYVNNSIVYDIVEEDIEGQLFYRFKRRPIKEREESTIDEDLIG